MSQPIYQADLCPETFRAAEKKKHCSKPWLKFLAKLGEYQSRPVEEWNEYQLLGYAVSRTQMVLRYEGTQPNHHPEVVKMRRIIKTLCGRKEMPSHWLHAGWTPYVYHSEPIKRFVDWCLDKAYSQQIYTLGYITNGRFLEQYQPEMSPPEEGAFDPSLLDLGDLV